MSFIRKAIRHPLFILVAGFILTSYSVGVRQLLVWIGYALSYEIPLWVFIAIAALVLVAIAIIAKFSSREPRSSLPEYCSYISEELHGVLWKWKWSRDYNSDLLYTVSQNDLCGYCPACQMALDDTEEDYFYGAVNYVCDSDFCDWTWETKLKPVKQGSYGRTTLSQSELKAKVAKEIERRVRTNEWRKAGAASAR